MLLSTYGHATLAVYDEFCDYPCLVTDPWLYGSCYFRSWHLDNYPSTTDISFLSKCRYVYYTHEHPDHFHTPSLRKFFSDNTQVLVPSIPSRDWYTYIESLGFSLSHLPSTRWISLQSDLNILSIPLWTNDSILLVKSGSSLVVNLNDSKPPLSLLTKISKFALANDLEIILLSSYSPASIVNSFISDDDLSSIMLRDRSSYVNYISRISKILGARFFVPFASQSIQRRKSSMWANVYKVTYSFLKDSWDQFSPITELVPPYSTLDLATCRHLSHSSHKNPSSHNLLLLTEQREHAESSASDCLNSISLFWRQSRFLHPLLLFFGVSKIGFELGSYHFTLHLFNGSVSSKNDSLITFVIPPIDFIEAVSFNRFVDLGISFLLRIKISPSRIKPKLVYTLFLWLQLREYGHLSFLSALRVLIARFRTLFNIISIPSI